MTELPRTVAKPLPDASRPKPEQRVVVVDLDHTLIKGDTLHEQVVRLIFQKPRQVPALFSALFRGRAAVKTYCADHIVLDPEAQHTCDEVMGFLGMEKARGSYIVLCSAADERVAQGIANHLGVFDEVIATREGVNLKGSAKSALLVRRFPRGFIYAGDHAADLHVWSHASEIVLVGTSEAVRRKARALGKPIVAEFRPRTMKRRKHLAIWARALRVHHWSKNLLMFVPLVLAHQWHDSELVLRTCIGFVLLLAVTSASYLINDLADLDADRKHATKRRRPIASGALPLVHAGAFAAIVIPLALLAAVLLSPLFAVALVSYLALTLAYSFGLKRIPLFDTFIIAVLFTSRLLMGSAFIGAVLPVWLVTFSMFFFFSLATAKRHAEIVRAGHAGGDGLAARGYEPADGPLTLSFGIGAGLGSLIILVLYMVDEAFKLIGYSRPEFLWVVVAFLGVWVGRVWLLTHRGRMNDDPVAFALRDRPSQLLALLIAACFLIAL